MSGIVNAKKQCSECKGWNAIDAEICSTCEFPFNGAKGFMAYYQKARGKTSKLDLWLVKLSHSDKLGHKIMHKIIRLGWLLYMSVLATILYLVALFSG